MIHDLFARFDDLTIVSGDPDRSHAFTLTGLVHNEMHFLPVFLPHYRALGIDRFIFIDDRSDDGTTAFLARQPDVVVLQSGWRYGHRLTLEEAERPEFAGFRMARIWRNLLLQKFCRGAWSLHLDADEFLDLPIGMLIPELAARLEKSGNRSAWSVMLDMYPETVADLFAMSDDPVIDFDQPWHFDGRPHLRLRGKKDPRVIYGGVRSRLMLGHGLNPKANWFDRNIARRIGLAPKRYNNIRKPILLHWDEEAVLHSSHSVSLPASDKVLLPLRHYKFNGAIAQRIKWAIESGSYGGASSEYFALEKLLTVMQQQDKGFGGPHTRRYLGFTDFTETDNALGFG